MDAEFMLVSNDTKNSIKQQELAEKSQFSKAYAKWAILAKMQRGDRLQNSRFWPFSWPNFVRLENRQYLSDFSLISMDGCRIYASF